MTFFTFFLAKTRGFSIEQLKRSGKKRMQSRLQIFAIFRTPRQFSNSVSKKMYSLQKIYNLSDLSPLFTLKNPSALGNILSRCLNYQWSCLMLPKYADKRAIFKRRPLEMDLEYFTLFGGRKWWWRKWKYSISMQSQDCVGQLIAARISWKTI